MCNILNIWMINSALYTSSYLVAYSIRSFIFEVLESSDFIWTEWSLRNRIWLPSDCLSLLRKPRFQSSWHLEPRAGAVGSCKLREKGDLCFRLRKKPDLIGRLYSSVQAGLGRSSFLWELDTSPEVRQSDMVYVDGGASVGLLETKLGVGDKRECSLGNFWNYLLWLEQPVV